MGDAVQQEGSAGLPHPDDLRGYVDYLRDLGIYDLLTRNADPDAVETAAAPIALANGAENPRRNAAGNVPATADNVAAWANAHLRQPLSVAGQQASSPVDRTASSPSSTAASGRVGSMQGSATPTAPTNQQRPAAPTAPRPGTSAPPPLSPFDQAQQRRAAANAPRPNSGPDIQITPPIAPAAPVPRPAAAPPSQNISAAAAGIVTAEMAAPTPFNLLAPLPAERVAPVDKPAALLALRNHIGDCTRCPLAYAGRHSIVYADGDPSARLLFVGEGPGADEDEQGIPFVGKAGQLLNNMIAAMGLRREEVYIANIVKCRPPKNRVPEPMEANTCSPFLLQQIDIVAPEVTVALGSTAATYLLGKKQSLSSLRGQWFDVRGAKCAVTYHPAFLLRDPRQKGEAWKDLQRVMAELKLKPPAPRA